MHQIACYNELLVLLWKACDENATFLSHILTHCDAAAVSTCVQVVGSLVCVCMCVCVCVCTARLVCPARVCV